MYLADYKAAPYDILACQDNEGVELTTKNVFRKRNRTTSISYDILILI